MQVFRRPTFLVFLSSVVVGIVGCETQTLPISFVYSTRTEELMDEAKDGIGEAPGVKPLVEERFGQPEDLALWNDLPLNFGGIKGTVAEFKSDGSGSATVKLDLSEPYEKLRGRPEPRLQFTNGAAENLIVDVENWDAQTSTATINGLDGQEIAAGDKVMMDAGSVLRFGHELYMQHCLHCHGVTGDGQGPTAKYLWPRPRDFRHGISKFTSTTARAKPSRDDYKRTLQKGIPGTYMPSFVPLMDDEKLDAVVEYVRFLSMRGEFERSLVAEVAIDYSTEMYQERLADEETPEEILEELTEFMEEDMVDIAADASDDLIEDWEEAEDETLFPETPRVPDTIESRRKGRALYLSKALNCADCHGIAAAGNGPQSMIFEKNTETGELYPEEGLHDVWHNVNQPRDLTKGIYRGGRRPVDLFRRLRAGIKGTRMPAFKSQSDEELWHLVNYVLSIPFEVDPGAPEPVKEKAEDGDG